MGWFIKSQEESVGLGEMANFFCKLHLLANFVSDTDKVWHGFESMVLSDSCDPVFAFNTK